MYNPYMYTLHGIYHGLWERMIASSFITPLACGKLAETISPFSQSFRSRPILAQREAQVSRKKKHRKDEGEKGSSPSREAFIVPPGIPSANRKRARSVLDSSPHFSEVVC